MKKETFTKDEARIILRFIKSLFLSYSAKVTYIQAWAHLEDTTRCSMLKMERLEQEDK